MDNEVVLKIANSPDMESLSFEEFYLEFARRLQAEWAKGEQVANPERIAQLIAHRACCGAEHDPANGKLHGYCVICGVPWPCEYAGHHPAPVASAPICACGDSFTAEALCHNCVAGLHVTPAPDAFLFTLRYTGKGKASTFAAIDYRLQDGEELLRKEPLYLHHPAPVAQVGEPVAWVDLDRWLSGNYSPDECFTGEEIGRFITPVYAAPVAPICACGDSFTAEALCHNCVAGLTVAPAPDAQMVSVPVETMEHWLEYWNGNRNDSAMFDALEHILSEMTTLFVTHCGYGDTTKSAAPQNAAVNLDALKVHQDRSNDPPAMLDYEQNAAAQDTALKREEGIARVDEQGSAIPVSAAPVLAEWEDPRVQFVYELLCNEIGLVPPNPDEHWEGYLARKIVGGVTATSSIAITRNQANEAVSVTRQDEEGRVLEVLWTRPDGNVERDARWLIEQLQRLELIQNGTCAYMSPRPNGLYVNWHQLCAAIEQEEKGK